ncbi:hypothetical protein GO988_06955 [Hymenobacter sp. HMF4947]|uniref:Uncharacterized protein n=1 Tax=Hymenobacter ginkgonis TaxID=2682976 RepID=A0A7K1TCC8_9BACT|nr:hypothetical protein [Hymenobacter ginkgonis]MVN76059.1 hypothetical protein [Hymenobacter ginkgonis]
MSTFSALYEEVLAANYGFLGHQPPEVCPGPFRAAHSPLTGLLRQAQSKSSLTAAEQEELRSSIEKVGTEIPTTVMQFDVYGKDLDINTDKA